MNLNRERELARWRGMLRRCENSRDKGYRYYGARGIKVCERWHDFEAYYADIMELLGPCPYDKSLDRIDNDGGYEPGNVRWATAAEQQANSRNARPGPWRDERLRKRAANREARREAERVAKCAAVEAERLAAEHMRKSTSMRTAAEVCAALSIGDKEFLALVETGQLTAMTISPHTSRPWRIRSLRVSELWLEEYIARQLPAMTP